VEANYNHGMALHALGEDEKTRVHKEQSNEVTCHGKYGKKIVDSRHQCASTRL
jgi:hypothetical protein